MLQAPQPLDSSHVLDTFDCGKSVLNEWLLRHALQAQSSGSARTFVVLDDQRLVGYFSLSVGQVDVLSAPERISRGMGRYPIPVAILARIGAGMLREAIARTLTVAEQVGIRALLTHPLDEVAAHFYRRFGFESSPASEAQLLLLLKDARKLLAG